MGGMLPFLAQALTPASEFLKNGALGAAIVVLAGVVAVLWRKSEALQEQRAGSALAHQAALSAQAVAHQEALAAAQTKRVEDAQAVTAQLMRTTGECVTALTNSTNAMEALREAMSEQRDELRGRPSRR